MRAHTHRHTGVRSSCPQETTDDGCDNGPRVTVHLSPVRAEQVREKMDLVYRCEHAASLSFTKGW